MSLRSEPMRWKHAVLAAPSGAAEALHDYAERRASAEEVGQLRERLAALLADGARPSARPAARTLQSVWVQIGLLAGAGLAWWALMQPGKPAVPRPAPARATQSAPAAAAVGSEAAALEPAQSQGLRAQTPAAIPESVRKPPARPRRRVPERVQLSAASVELSPQRELELLAKAQQVLPRSPQAAEALLAEHARDYPHGVFEQEREKLQIDVALAQREQARARELSRNFLRQYPASPYRRQLEKLFAVEATQEDDNTHDTQGMDPNDGGKHAQGSSR